MLRMRRAEWEQLRQHGEQAYPHESCGVLLGELAGDDRLVSAVVRCGNTRTDSPHNRYHIAPQELIRIQRQARDKGWDIVGFYHSHPEHPARWSQTDFAEAHWIGCSYVITAVERGRATVTISFALTGSDEEDKRFLEEPIELTN